MHRLGEMTDQQRNRYGGGALVVGLLLLVVGITLVHIYGRAAEDVPTTAPFEWMFTVIPTESHFWFKGIGYLVVFAATQLLVVGTALIWLLNQKMTWARAMFAAFVAWVELVIIFGIVPSEWLNFSQTDLDWSFQRAWFQVPPALVLGNDVTVSYGALKDAISGGYNVMMLVAAGIFAYKLQDVGKPRPAAAAAEEEKISPYGRPLSKQAAKDET